MTQPHPPSPYVAYQSPEFSPPPMASATPTERAVSAADLRAEAAGLRSEAVKGRWIAVASLLAGMVATVVTMVYSRSLGGYYVAFLGPVVYAFNRVRNAGELGRKATFLAATADRWEQGPGANGQLMPRAAVDAEFARREAAVKEKQDRGLPKSVWLGLLLILAMLMLLLWTT